MLITLLCLAKSLVFLSGLEFGLQILDGMPVGSLSLLGSQKKDDKRLLTCWGVEVEAGSHLAFPCGLLFWHPLETGDRAGLMQLEAKDTMQTVGRKLPFHPDWDDPFVTVRLPKSENKCLHLPQSANCSLLF